MCWYSVVALSKHSLSEDISLSLLFIADGIFLDTDGGWLLFAFYGAFNLEDLQTSNLDI